MKYSMFPLKSGRKRYHAFIVVILFLYIIGTTKSVRNNEIYAVTTINKRNDKTIPTIIDTVEIVVKLLL